MKDYACRQGIVKKRKEKKDYSRTSVARKPLEPLKFV